MNNIDQSQHDISNTFINVRAGKSVIERELTESFLTNGSPQKVKSLNKSKKILDKEGKHNTHMSNRDEQWFLGDKKLLFACDDLDIFTEWVRSLKELLNLE